MSAEKNIYTHLHLRGNELRGFVFERLESDPDPIDGRIYYNVAKNEFRACISGVWVNIFSIWHVDDDGNITTDKQVIIKNNLIVEEDTGSGGDGEDTVTGIIGVVIDGVTYRNTADGLLDLSDAFDNVSVDLSNYYTKSQVDAKIQGIDLNLYATKTYVDNKVSAVTSEVYTKSQMDNLLGKYVTLSTAQTISGAKTFTALLTATGGMRITGDVEIDGNLIVTGDTASGDEGEDTVVGITGVKVNDVTYTDTDGDGIIDLGTISGGSGGTVSGGISSVKLNGVTYTDNNGDGIIDLGSISGGSGGSEGITFEELEDFLTTNKYLQVNNWGVKGQILMADFTGTPIWADPSAIGFLPLTGGTMQGSIDTGIYSLYCNGEYAIGSQARGLTFGNFDSATVIRGANSIDMYVSNYDSIALAITNENITSSAPITIQTSFLDEIQLMIMRPTGPQLSLHESNGGLRADIYLLGGLFCFRLYNPFDESVIASPLTLASTFVMIEKAINLSVSTSRRLTALRFDDDTLGGSISLGYDNSMALMFTDMNGDSYEVVHAGNYSKYITGGVECLPLTGGTIEGDLTLNGSFMFPTWKMYEDSTVFSLASLSENGEYTRMFALSSTGGLSVRGLYCGSTTYSTAELGLVNSNGLSFIIVDSNGVLLYQAYNSSACKILHSGNYMDYLTGTGNGSSPVFYNIDGFTYMQDNGAVSGTTIFVNKSFSFGNAFKYIFPRSYLTNGTLESCIIYIKGIGTGTNNITIPVLSTSGIGVINQSTGVLYGSVFQYSLKVYRMSLLFAGLDDDGYAVWHLSMYA